jgi:hypothetical protein
MLTWFFHKDAGRFNDRSEIWSDRAGYYIYLPATFFYHFNTHSMPPDLDIKTGGGFSIDTVNNKIDIKYTYGVALMVSPFFLTAHLVSRIAGFDDENGFSLLYHRMMNLAAVVYLLAGLWFLKKFLDHYFQPAITFFVTVFIFLGTNLFYYSLIEGLMSHVYSFFLFALFLFSLKLFLDTRNYRYFLLFTVSLVLATLIRPTNIILILVYFFWDSGNLKTISARFKQFLKPSYILVFLLVLLLFFLPQLIYWHYLSGNLFHFSYRGEGFTNWTHPVITGVLFSPVNGFFIFNPLALIFFTGMIIMIMNKTQNGKLIVALFLIVTIICASWKMWYFGCSFGQRSYIEYYTLFAVPFGWVVTELFKNRHFFLSVILFFFIFFFTYVNIRMTIVLYRFERCYYGSTWDWDHYIRYVERAGIISPVEQPQSFKNDFENLALTPVKKPSVVFTHSGQYSIVTEKRSDITPLFSVPLNEFGDPVPKMIDVEAWIFKPGSLQTGASLSYTFSRDQKVLFDDELKIDSAVKKPMTWVRVNKTFIVPDIYDTNLRIDVFIFNPKRLIFYIDDLRIHYDYSWKF